MGTDKYKILNNSFMNCFKLFSYIPFFNLLSLLVLILHVYFLYGHLPTYSNPDPKALPFTFTIFMIFEVLLFLTFILYPILIIINIYKKTSKKILFKNIVVYLTSLIFLIIIYRLDRYELGTWILD